MSFNLNGVIFETDMDKKCLMWLLSQNVENMENTLAYIRSLDSSLVDALKVDIHEHLVAHASSYLAELRQYARMRGSIAVNEHISFIFKPDSLIYTVEHQKNTHLFRAQYQLFFDRALKGDHYIDVRSNDGGHADVAHQFEEIRDYVEHHIVHTYVLNPNKFVSFFASPDTFDSWIDDLEMIMGGLEMPISAIHHDFTGFFMNEMSAQLGVGHVLNKKCSDIIRKPFVKELLGRAMREVHGGVIISSGATTIILEEVDGIYKRVNKSSKVYQRVLLGLRLEQ